MPVNVGDVVRISARMLLDNVDDIVNVYHFLVQVNTTLDDVAFMTEVAQSMDALYTLVNPQIANNVSYNTIDGINVTQAQLLPATGWPVLTAGLNVTEMLPEMCSGCVFHRTLVPKVRASKFLPPFGANTNLDGAMEPNTRTNMQAFGDLLTLGLVLANTDLRYVAFNRALSTFTPVVQAVIPARFRTQRRRRKGVGS